MKNFCTLTDGEIRKVNKAGHGLIGDYYTTPSEVEGFVDVVCSVYGMVAHNVVAHVTLIVCLFDRRLSWISKVVTV